MNLDYEAIEHLKLALSRLSKAKRLLQNELMKVESCNNMNEFSELYIVRKGCTKAWAAAHKELDFARAII